MVPFCTSLMQAHHLSYLSVTRRLLLRSQCCLPMLQAHRNADHAGAMSEMKELEWQTLCRVLTNCAHNLRLTGRRDFTLMA